MIFFFLCGEQNYQAVTVGFVRGSRLEKELGLHCNGITSVWDHLVVKTLATPQRYLSIINSVELCIVDAVQPSQDAPDVAEGDDKLKPDSLTLIDGFSWTFLWLQCRSTNKNNEMADFCQDIILTIFTGHKGKNIFT